MRKLRNKFILTGLFLLLPFILTGCFLKLLFASVGERDQDFTTVFIATIGGTFGPTAWCDFDPQTSGLVDCSYFFLDLGAETVYTETSSAYLLSELGVLGLFIDPIILQVPQASTNFSGTIRETSANHPIVATEVNAFFADPGNLVTPEVGQKFVILEFPEDLLAELTTNGVLNGPYDFTFEFELPSLDPVQVKAMYAGKVQVGGRTFYPPMLPCTTDFAAIPALTIPVSTTPADLLTPIIDSLSQGPSQGCATHVYDFITGLSFPHSVYLPLIQD